jgi:beta-lactamase class A
MRSTLRLFLLVVLVVGGIGGLLGGCVYTIEKKRPPALVQEVDAVIRHYGGRGVTIAVAYRDLATGKELLRSEHVKLHAASTMKVPVMVALFQAAGRGDLKLDQPVAVRNEFRSIVDGSPFHLDPKEDGDPELYRSLGTDAPLDELMRRMIVKSSNLATNLLIELVGAPRVMERMRDLGAEDLLILRGVEDQKAFDAGLNNKVTAYDLMLVLAAVALGRPESSERMLDILKRQEFNEKIPAGLPPGTPVAHKTGDITKVHHDAAIVYPPGGSPYVLVVLTAGIADEKVANQAIAEISRAVWEGRSATVHPARR